MSSLGRVEIANQAKDANKIALEVLKTRLVKNIIACERLRLEHKMYISDICDDTMKKYNELTNQQQGGGQVKKG